ncbi:MAG: hypothetical protein HKO94_08300, partial [Flavobacteriaceae bacterium]|nr:hypothetical protein [Flavobacteriaceae bacterium]
MNKTILLLLILVSLNVRAQFIKEKSIDVSIGYGLSAPYDDVKINGIGFYAQGEFVLSLAKWIDLRPYAGLILTMDNEGDDGLGTPDYQSIANAALIGGKIRLTAPIPWVAPYIEGGVGASIGSFETYTPLT